ncbi:MAG: hypothetical protein ABSD08_14955 [Xanthobacteraceae bacterium]
MSFEASLYASSLQLPLRAAPVALRGPLTQLEAQILADKLANDSQKSIYSALISVADALRGLEQGFSTWPAVKLYYTTFYAIRALLALEDICLYYVSNKEYWIECIASSFPARAPNRVRGSTHKFVFAVFEQRFPNSPLLSQTIDGEGPFDWLMLKREEANYISARFIEPQENQLFKFVRKHGIRRLCLEYLKDDSFAFDPDHAILSYPMFLLRHIRDLGVRGRTCVLDEAEDEKYERYFADQFGPLQPLIDLKRRILL